MHHLCSTIVLSTRLTDHARRAVGHAATLGVARTTAPLLALVVACVALAGCASNASTTKNASAGSGGSAGANSTAPASADDPRRASPDAALAALREGNARFVAGSGTSHHNARERVGASSQSQYPVASVFACADSRTPPEAIFDLGIGDVFVCRVAGVASGVNDDASLEYGAAVLGSPVIVVMGHRNCGAMKAAIADGPLPGSLPALVAQIRPAVDRARQAHPDADAKKLLEFATNEQVMAEVGHLLTTSPVLRESVGTGKIKIVGAIYSLDDGTVQWLGEHPHQAALLAQPLRAR